MHLRNSLEPLLPQVHYLRKQLPYTAWGRKDKQKRLIDRLEREFVMCARRYELPRGDFPPIEPFRQALLGENGSERSRT